VRGLLKKHPTIEVIYKLVAGHREITGNEAADHWEKQRAMVQTTSESLKYVWNTRSLSQIITAGASRCQIE
jgi:hypothetical protein